MIQIVCTAITGICTIVVAIVSKRLSNSSKKQETATKLRQEESYLSMQMMDATLQLSVACCNALCGGHNNGNVERAKDAATQAKANYETFLQKVASHEVGK